MSVAGRLRTARLAAALRDQRDFYGRHRTREESRRWQLDRWNELWAVLGRTSPYYGHLRRAHSLPDRFESWERFADLVPVQTRDAVRSHRDEMTDPARPPGAWRSTGGSTAEPLRIPVWKSEARVAADAIWHARSWFGVTPADKLFLIWGHSHLLGRGLAGRINALRRGCSDRLLGYRRWSAYRVGDDDLRAAADSLIRFRPAYLLGYSVALDRFARANAGRRDEFRRLGLKVVIATAESFPRADSAETLADLFGCPVAMEYGAVETGPIAHQRPDGLWSVFWRNYFVEAVPDPALPGRSRIAVTALFPRCLPLVRYALGDLIEPNPADPDPSREFLSITGRCNDVLTLPGGLTVHSEAVTHAVKESPITGFQVVQSPGRPPHLRYTSAAPLAAVETDDIRRRLALVATELGSIGLERVPALERTIAGKTRRVVNAEPPAPGSRNGDG